VGGGFGEVADRPAPVHGVVVRIAGLEQPLEVVKRVCVASLGERRRASGDLHRGEDGRGAGGQRDAFGLLHERLVASHPLGRIAEPEEVADSIVWLAGSKSSYVTGVALPVDGGYLAQ
jgi:NAD(P)-dependent dehydrogenase (short-subunit alcohol dehydrogenase family)